MKRIYKNFVWLFFIVAAISCTDDKLLDKTPFNKVAESEAFNSPENVRLSVNGMYQSAAMGKFSGSARGYVWGAAWVEQNDNRGEDVVNMASFYAITYESTYNASTANNMYYWHDGYGLINKANLVIEGVTKAKEEGVISAEEADDYIGQALFFRAITHFELNKMFARPYNHTSDHSHLGIILRTTPINTAEALEAGEQVGRSTVAEVYKSVIDDLNDAEKMITGANFGNSLLRVSSDAAVAFKTRVYLHMREWDKVISEADKLNGKYELTPEPSGVFDDNVGNTESIFSIDQTSVANGGVNGALGSQYGRRELVAISPIIWNNDKWLLDDKRRATVDIDAGEDFDSQDSDGIFVRRSGGILYTNKYRDQSTYEDKSPIIRYAEVLLNRAEAYARTNELGKALTDLNAVRDRALANPATQSYTAVELSSPKEMVQAIVMERRIEFLMEGNRFSDIHRLQGDNLAPINGIPAKVENGVSARDGLYDAASGNIPETILKAIPYEDDRFIWPLPNTEMANNPAVKDQQNPGY